MSGTIAAPSCLNRSTGAGRRPRLKNAMSGASGSEPCTTNCTSGRDELAVERRRSQRRPRLLPSNSGSVRGYGARADRPARIIPPEIARFRTRQLLRTARAHRRLVLLVAIGSLSTYGEGASSPEWSYPNRLRLESTERFPGQSVVAGQFAASTATMITTSGARFQRDVIAEKPDALWYGTNSMLGGDPMETHLPILMDGVAHGAGLPGLTSC